MESKNKIELLAPAGDKEKLETALHFGADAVYFAGKNYGLRAMSSNFTNEEMEQAIEKVHSLGKKAYVTLNIYAHNKDFAGLEEYLHFLEKIKVDAVLVSDLGILSFIKEKAPSLNIHISTQANTTNKFSVAFYEKLGAERVVLARELSLEEIAEIHKANPNIELEVFVHGAMCISYSGRCLLSNYLTGRDANHGECVQACRWKYYITEEKRLDKHFEIQEDDRGAYIMNSKDLCLIEYLDKIIDAGVFSLKIEGRMKSPYYVGTVVNAYRRAIDNYFKCKEERKPYRVSKKLLAELDKASHREYTTGFVVDGDELRQNFKTNAQEQSSKFVAIVKEVHEGKILVEQRNKFVVGEKLEILSPTDAFQKTITISKMEDKNHKPISEAKDVCAPVWIYTKIKNIQPNDILRQV